MNVLRLPISKAAFWGFRSWFSKPLALLGMLLLLGLAGCASNTGLLGGGNWQSRGLQNQHIQALAVNPTHLQDIYAGDAQAGVFASTDSGATWHQSSSGLPQSLTVNTLAFDLAGKKLYAGTAAGLFVSSDAAHSWSAVANVPADMYIVLAFDANTPSAVYVGTARSGVLKSADDGKTWVAINNGLPGGNVVTSLVYDPNLKQLWVAFADAIYRSDDAGESWRRMSDGIPAGDGINAVALGVAVNSTGSIYAGTNHGFFISTDAGQHWAPSHLSLASLSVHAILLDANLPQTVYISTNIGVLSSSNNGQDWNRLAAGLPTNQPVSGLVQGAENNSQLYAAARGVYLYPGNGSVLDLSRLLPIVLVLLFFFLLYVFVTRNRRRAIINRPGKSVGVVDDVAKAES